jgi:hypothetical protein
MTRSISLTLAVAAVLVAAPVSAQPLCLPHGDTVCLNLLWQSDSSGPYCMVDRSGNGVVPPLLEASAYLVKWRVNSDCKGKYTVSIIPSSIKANMTAPVPCYAERTFDGPAVDDENLVCPFGPDGGKYGYLVAVCPAVGDCKCTDPGIWIPKKKGPPDVPTSVQIDASKKETMTVRTCTRSELEKLREGMPAAKKAAPKPEPKR